ncbi:tetratricopeptide repeat domain containing protein [Acanthamoeba castellanii str. Neff]|uniref:Tetratricopeptide repeat domain containing protein n=1 Tax=Acanthamoeba castellanii (strain ATCC 30010 / Neff) TaxID=1257118 RepID=L8H9C1_ACACF|nr:tetratricopeptide repeat domain containing protein [Acanthamoeba castellanii str. Neff]ELR21780.1 tetratricopeptide repeat domain containing protein [Acanthamoeba castellanii str. Neff]
MEDEVNEILQEVVKILWNADYAKADELLAPHKDNHPAVATMYAQSMWLRAVVTETAEESKEAFERMEADRLNKIKKNKGNKGGSEQEDLTEAPRTSLSLWCSIIIPHYLLFTTKNVQQEQMLALLLWSKLSLAEVTLFESILKFKMQKQVKGEAYAHCAYNFRKSWKHYEECVELIKTLSEKSPYFTNLACSLNVGIGFFHFFISVVPRQFLWLVEAIGFKADRDLALKELQLASESEGFQSSLAFFLLVTIRTFFFEELEAGRDMFNLLMEQYPMQAKLDEAKELFLAAKEKFIATNNKQLELFCVSEIATLEYLNLNFAEAVQGFEQFLTLSTVPGLKALCYYQSGICYSFLFHEDKAKECMTQALKYVRKGYAHDEFAKQRAKKFLTKGGVSDFERKFIRARILHEGRQFQLSLEMAEQAEAVAVTDEDRACVAFMRGDALRELKRDEAEQAFMVVLNTPTKSISKYEQYVLPWSLSGMAELKLEQNDHKAALDLYKRAKKYSGYDYETWVAWRIKRGMDRLRVRDTTH